jgi:hypothetical protein
MKHNIGNIELSDEVIALLKVETGLKGWSMRQLSSHALTLYVRANERQIMNAVKLRAKKYGISNQEAFHKLFFGEGFDRLKIVNPAPVLTEAEKEQHIDISLEDLDFR